jgi:hypothetical protein
MRYGGSGSGPIGLLSAGSAATSPADIVELRKRIMRAETERLVEEIKQSVGLLRRHL